MRRTANCGFLSAANPLLCQLVSSEVDQMDPNKPPDLSSMTGVPWLGRRRGPQPEEPAVGRSRGLLLSAEGPGLGRARGFPAPGDAPQGRGVTLPFTEPAVGRGRGLLLRPDDGGVGRARGLLFPAAEPKVEVARGAVLPRLEPQHAQTPPCEATTRDLTQETSAAKEVATRNVFTNTHSLCVLIF